MQEIKSKNFQFLCDHHHPLLVEYALRAEQYVFLIQLPA